MRFIYQILIGLFLFNGFLILFSGFFPTGTTYGAIDVTDEYSEYGEFNNPNFILDMLFGDNGLAKIALGGLIIGGFVATIFMKTLVPLAIGAFMGLVSGLYFTTASVLYNLSPSPIVQGLISIIGIIIGILAAFIIIEKLSGQQGAD